MRQLEHSLDDSTNARASQSANDLSKVRGSDAVTIYRWSGFTTVLYAGLLRIVASTIVAPKASQNIWHDCLIEAEVDLLCAGDSMQARSHSFLP